MRQAEMIRAAAGADARPAGDDPRSIGAAAHDPGTPPSVIPAGYPDRLGVIAGTCPDKPSASADAGPDDLGGGQGQPAARRSAEAAERLSTTQLIAECRRERASFWTGQARASAFGIELFRRAICERDNLAWEAILTDYRGLVVSWIRRHPAANLIDEDDDVWVCRTFERFWIALKPERWAQFRDLPAVLQYIKLCAHSVLVDAVRARAAANTTSLDGLADVASAAPDVEERLVGALAGCELWQRILRLVPDETERLVARLSFVHDLAPREVYARHPARFASVGEVYRIKRNIVERLRRNLPQQRTVSG